MLSIDFFKKIFTETHIKNAFAVVLLIIIFYSVKDLSTLILLTFLFSFLLSKFQNFIHRNICKIKPISKNTITISMYLVLLAILISVICTYIPTIIKELISLKDQIANSNINIYDSVLNNYKGITNNHFMTVFKGIDINKYIGTSSETIIKLLIKIEKLSTDIIFALVLSLFFVAEQNSIKSFGKKIEDSKISYIYTFYKYLGEKFLNSFGKIMTIQITISFINAVLASIGFIILGFDNVLGLGFMMFILTLIPTVGTFIALIPLTIVAFSSGGISKIIYLLILLAILHVFESYIIKPKLMASSINVPISFTFVILIISEHFMGIWGLLIGVPLFVFFLDLMNINTDEG